MFCLVFGCVQKSKYLSLFFTSGHTVYTVLSNVPCPPGLCPDLFCPCSLRLLPNGNVGPCLMCIIYKCGLKYESGYSCLPQVSRLKLSHVLTLPLSFRSNVNYVPPTQEVSPNFPVFSSCVIHFTAAILHFPN